MACTSPHVEERGSWAVRPVGLVNRSLTRTHTWGWIRFAPHPHSSHTPLLLRASLFFLTPAALCSPAVGANGLVPLGVTTHILRSQPTHPHPPLPWRLGACAHLDTDAGCAPAEALGTGAAGHPPAPPGPAYLLTSLGVPQRTPEATGVLCNQPSSHLL